MQEDTVSISLPVMTFWQQNNDIFLFMHGSYNT